MQQEIIVASAALFPEDKMRGTSILLLNLFTTDAFNKAFIVKLGELHDHVGQAHCKDKMPKI
jgi:hypothetical protein